MANDGNDTSNLTFTVGQDGAVVAKGADGAEVRYVKEADLMAVKGSKEAAEQRVKELEVAGTTGGAGSDTAVEEARQKVLQAEAQVESLKAQIAAGTATATERDNLKKELETAQQSGEQLNSKLLELQRTLITATYGVPKATVENKKTMQELETYAQALADVTGKPLGNYAVGGGGGGTDLSGKSPMELARMAYESSNK